MRINPVFFLSVTLFVGCAAPAATVAPATPPAAPAGAKVEAPAEKEPFGRLTIEDVEAKIALAKQGKTAFYVFDNNQKSRFEQGHVPGAKWVPSDAVKEADLPADKNATLVFYCGSEHCTACHNGAENALKLGYKSVYIMPAGIAGWEKAGKAVEK
jgi:rhodanese-related sulfurtransferase